MKQLTSLLVCCLLSLVAIAQDFTKIDTLRFVDAMQFRMINYAFEKTLDTRIPRYLEDSVRAELKERARHTAGKGFRFRTDSRAVAVRYQLLYNAHMMHMADTGIKGTCLYIWDEDTRSWQFVNGNRPNANKEDTIQRKVCVDRLDGKMHEYMLYLPLYDGVRWLEIGVDSTATISQPVLNSPRQGKKFVFYGTSILHGGCATQPGMVAFIIDPIPNCTQMMCDTLTYDFINILRKARPDVPIVMVEGQMYSYAKYSGFFGKYLPQKNYEFHKNYLRLRAENPKNLYYIDCKNPD